MSNSPQVERYTVSLYLLKASSMADAENALFAQAEPGQSLITNIPDGRFLPLPVDASPPRWTAFVQQLLPPQATVGLLSQAPGALLWIPRGGKNFIITFGSAHLYLKDEWLEPEFGKKVALSVVPQGKVVELRSEQVFARRHVSSERAPKAASVRDFGFEADRDLVAAVEGEPDAQYVAILGVKVRGGTSLRFGLEFGNLLATLDVVAERFDSNAYRKIWPQMNNLSPVRDDASVAALDAKLDAVLGANKPETHIALAAPVASSNNSPYPDHFVIGRLTAHTASAPYLLFGNWVALMLAQGKALSSAHAKQTGVHMLDEKKDRIATCTMYDCFGAEASLSGNTFILSGGIWQQAKRQFIKETNDIVQTLKPPSYLLSTWNKIDDEGTYNAGVCIVDKSLWLFDKKNVWFGGGQSRFEFCDMMHWPSRTLYFVKQPTASAGLSHLCEQVRRTSENFFSVDSSFRTKLEANIKKEKKIKNTSWLKSRPKRQDWNLCLVAMGKDASKFPFFAKCGIARLVRELEHRGFNVSFQEV